MQIDWATILENNTLDLDDSYFLSLTQPDQEKITTLKYLYDLFLTELITTTPLTTASVPDSTNRRYVTNAQLAVVGNTSGVNTGDQSLAGLQPIDSDLATIAGLTPANDDIIQRKAGAWANRTIAQYKTDLAMPIAGHFSGVGTATTAFTVTWGTTLSNNTYAVNVTPTAVLSAALFYVTNKTTTTFDVVYLAGLTGTVTFDYTIVPIP